MPLRCALRALRAIATNSLIVRTVGASILIAGCSEGTAPPKPASVDKADAAPSAIAGLAIPVSPTFEVKDAGDKILGGVPFTVTVTAGGGSLSGIPKSTLSGAPTSIGTWILGRSAGPNTVAITVGDLAPLTITVNGVAGPPAAVVVVAGSGQAALAGTSLPSPVTVQVRDQFANGVGGSTVTFAANGGGSISPSSVVTDANGNASTAVWQLGRTAIPQSVTITTGTLTAIASATVASDYNVEVRPFGPPMPPEAVAAFAYAVSRVRASIVGDVPDVNLATQNGGTGFDLSNCSIAGITLTEVVDDVLIYATVTSIDGPGKILASAGPCLTRRRTGFAVIGVMRFDADDISLLASTGRLNDIVLHEMLHIVGVGTNWPATIFAGGDTADPRFTGVSGAAGCGIAGGSLTCATGIPVENFGGPGTADSHWRESVFDTELMTGFAEAAGVATPLSSMTIQSLGDEGYVVNPAAADPYTIPPMSAIRAQRANVMAADSPPWEIVLKPTFEVTPAGTVRKLVAQ